MNKKILNMMLCSLLAGSMATGFVSCKDYDDDITEINSTTSALSQQLKDLNIALEAAKADAAAAKSAADQATDAAAKAAEAAKAAAAEAKAEALKEVVAQVEMLQQQIDANASLSKENAEALAELTGRIEAIAIGLANIDLTDVNKQLGNQAKLIEEANKQIEAIQIQISALDEYDKQLKSLGSDIEDINTKLEAIETIKTNLAIVLDKATANEKNIKTNADNIAANKKSISDLKEDLEKISGQISKEVAAGVNTIAAVISQRLTSVTLMPDLYVNGIPTISFESAKYTKQKFENHKWVDATEGVTEFIITNNETTAQYRLNPATVTNEDIILSEMAYVTRVATSRAESVNDVVTVSSANVDGDGILTVKLGKANTQSLNRADGKINTVALRVPIAEKHLFTEQGETSANVYSEYNRLEEAYFQPEIMYVPGVNIDKSNTHPYTDSLAVYTSGNNSNIAKAIVFNKDYDLYELIEGCKFFANGSKHVAMTMEELRKYGMDINFQVATRDYKPTTTDMTDQQKWVKLSGENNHILTPVTLEGEAGNEAIIGKQPIIRAFLFDNVNKKIIDVRYFKVKFTAENMEPKTFEWPITVDGKPCDGASRNMTWEEVASKIITKININDHSGMSNVDFQKIYGNYTVSEPNPTDGTFTANVTDYDAAIPVFTWSVTKEQLGKLHEGDNTATYKKTVTFQNADGLYPDVVINFTFTVNTHVDELTLGKTEESKWGKDNTLFIYVAPMPTDYVATTDVAKKAHYATNILEGRAKSYVNGLTGCASYDIHFADGQGYVGDALDFQNGFGHWMMTKANQDNLNTITYSIPNTADGKELASKGKTIKLEWWSNINGLSNNPDNRYMFATMNLKVLPILTLNPESTVAIVDNSSVQTTQLAVEIYDAYKNLVAETVPDNATGEDSKAALRWNYYGVEKPTYVGDIKLADDANGTNARSLASINCSASVDTNGKLTFDNISGAPLRADAYLMVPVQVKHLWGELSGTIAVPLKKNPNLSTNR